MYREVPPPHHLRRHVACLWVRTSEPTADHSGDPHLIVPDGRTDLMSVDGVALVAGPDDRPIPVGGSIRCARDEPVDRSRGSAPGPAIVPTTSTIAGIRFRPGRAGVLGAPLGELRNRRVPLSDLWGADAAPLEDELAGGSVGEQLAALVHAVTRRIDASPAVDPLVADVVRRLASGERPAVCVLADGLGVSERHLRRRSTDALGYGPTTFARIVRFQRALERVRAGDPLAEVAATEGYADQAHLTREIRALSGRTPGAIARAAA